MRILQPARTTMGQTAPADGYERSDVPPRLIAALAIGLAAFIVVAPLLLQVINPVEERTADLSERPPAPRLQIDATADLERLRQAERSQLDAAGWIDHDQNIVRIPVQRAMQLVAKRGLPGWPKASEDLAATPVR